MKNKEYYERAAEILRYEPETGRLIRRVKTQGRGKIGDEAGTINNTGYRRIRVTVNGKTKAFLTHRIIWFIHNGDLPEFLDHRDGDRLNNRIKNLRPATRLENNRNSRNRKNSTSHYLGVYLNKRLHKWCAGIGINGESKHLGVFTDEEEAAKFYDAAAKAHFGEFANLNFK